MVRSIAHDLNIIVPFTDQKSSHGATSHFHRRRYFNVFICQPEKSLNNRIWTSLISEKFIDTLVLIWRPNCTYFWSTCIISFGGNLPIFVNKGSYLSCMIRTWESISFHSLDEDNGAPLHWHSLEFTSSPIVLLWQVRIFWLSFTFGLNLSTCQRQMHICHRTVRESSWSDLSDIMTIWCMVLRQWSKN